MLSQKALLLGASRRPELRRLVTGNPATRRVVDRFVAGEALDEVVDALIADDQARKLSAFEGAA